MKFERNRTLQSPKFAQKRRKRLFFTIFASTVGVIAALILCVLISRFPFFQIQSVAVHGLTAISSEGVEKAVGTTLVGDYIGIIPKTNIFFYPKNAIARIIAEQFPQIKNAKIHVQGLSTLSIDATERVSQVIVCQGFRDDESQDTCYHADTTGYVFEKVQDLASSTFKYYLNTASSSVTVSSSFIDAKEFSQLRDLVSKVGASGITTTGLLIGDDGSFELYIKNVDQSDAVVYFDNRIPFSKTFQNLVTFWQNTLNKKIGLTTIPNFEYINLRFGNNVFYLVK